MNLVNDLNRILILYTWGGVGFLLIMLYQIARFYQITSGEVSNYRWFALPLTLFALAAARYAWVGGLAGDPLGDIFLLLGGVSLFWLGYHVLRLMAGGRQ